MRGSALPAPIVDGMDYRGVKSRSSPIRSWLSAQPRWPAAVASGGTHTLAGFYPSGVPTTDPPGLPRPGLPVDRPPRGVAGPPGLPSHALRPVTTGNAPSAMSYRNCWHIVSPRLWGRRRPLPPPRLAVPPRRAQSRLVGR